MKTIQEEIDSLSETDKKLHDESLSEGYKDEICPTCGVVFLAHKHLVRCYIKPCPMSCGKSLLDLWMEELDKRILEEYSWRMTKDEIPQIGRDVLIRTKEDKVITSSISNINEAYFGLRWNVGDKLMNLETAIYWAYYPEDNKGVLNTK